MRIYKYPLIIDVRPQTLSLPLGAQVLEVHEQADSVCIWALVDENEELLKEYTFLVVGTGNGDPGGATYLGTAHLAGGTLVLHVFQQ